MDFRTVSVTPNRTASSDKVIDELKGVWKEKFAAQYRVEGKICSLIQVILWH